MLELLTHIAAIFSGPRYRPEIEWARDNWTHNAFRVFELLFGKRLTLRREVVVTDSHVFLCTLEAALAHYEGLVRKAIRENVPVLVPVPQFAGIGGPAAPFPYMLAIARDDTEVDNGASGSSSRSVTMTMSGSDRVLCGFPYHDNAAATVSSFTYDSVSMGTVVGSTSTANGDFESYLLVAPNTTAGASLSISLSASTYIFINAVSYTGAAQSGQSLRHAENSDATNGPNISATIDILNANAWVAAASRHDNGGTITGTSTITKIGSNTVNGTCTLDSNGTVSTGNNVCTSASTNNGGRYLVTIEVDVVTAAGPANLKSYDGNVKANIKSIAGNLIANVKSLSGNT